MLRLMSTMGTILEIVDVVELTPDEVVAKINDASTAIVRATAVDAESITDWPDAIDAIRDAWRGKPPEQRGVIFTDPNAWSICC